MEKLTIVLQDAPHGSENAYNALRYASALLANQSVAEQLLPWRSRHKKLAGFCLFFVITLVLLGIQVFARFDLALNGLLMLFAALFSWRVYKSNIPYGWF